MNELIRVSILIPVFNAEKTIELLCSTLITLYSGKYDLEIVLVNDCSTDSSDAICRQLNSRYPAMITYIRLSRNFGEHNALMAGLNYVTGDYCLMMDDDLQNPPEDAEKLINEIMKGYDVVYTYFPQKKDSLFRNIGSAFNDRVANIMLKKPASLYLSSFKIINRFLIKEISKYDGPDPYIDGIILRSTSSIGRVMVTHRERLHNSSGYTLGKLVSLWGNMVINYSLFPLRLVGIVGIVLITVGIFYGLYQSYDEFNRFGSLTEFETLMSLNMFFRGLLLLAVSVLGEYVGRIYLTLNKNPQFVIREMLSSKKRAGNIKHIGDLIERDGRRSS